MPSEFACQSRSIVGSKRRATDRKGPSSPSATLYSQWDFLALATWCWQTISEFKIDTFMTLTIAGNEGWNAEDRKLFGYDEIEMGDGALKQRACSPRLEEFVLQ
jgi:hypothetical protein